VDARFLASEETQAVLLELVENCDSMQWAVAWATENDVFDAAMAHRAKFKHLVIGTHMFQTDPKVLKRIFSVRAAAVVPPTGDLFHPKVYLFRNGTRIRCVVGSPNLTFGAMNRNVESSVLLDGTDTEQALVDLAAFVDDAWDRADSITNEFLYSYERQYEVKKKAREQLTKFAEIRRPTKDTTKAPQEMSWQDYLVHVRSKKHPSAHLFQKRLPVLAKARELFGTGLPFDAWNVEDRKIVAGTLGAKKSQQSEVDYGLFGSMGASGTFATSVINSPQGLSQALDCIPFTGDVTQGQFDQFCKRYGAAFGEEGRQGGLPTATRLLAMKRPDTFVCLDSANRKDLCENWGVPYSTTRLTNYWQRIIEPMQQAPWWCESVPINPADAELWHGRAAMLDAIYYTPKKQ
jgi:HKD family nuclease